MIAADRERHWAAMKTATLAFLAAAAVALASCEAKKSEAPASGAPPAAGKPAADAPKPPTDTVESTIPVKPEKEPEHIVVQHVLIAFEGSGTAATRSKAEAEALAKEVLDRARKGENFEELVKKYSDDAPPGIYAMANNGVAPDPSKQEYPRGRMVAAFGNVGFAVSPGNIDMAPFDPQKSPFGWHIIKRVK